MSRQQEVYITVFLLYILKLNSLFMTVSRAKEFMRVFGMFAQITLPRVYFMMRCLGVMSM